MKYSTLIIPAFLLILSIFFVFFLIKKRHGETGVFVEDSETSYNFSTSFNPALMPKVTPYVDSCTNVLRKNGVDFRVKTSEGELNISADKQSNSPMDIERIKKTCDGFRDVIFHP